VHDRAKADVSADVKADLKVGLYGQLKVGRYEQSASREYGLTDRWSPVPACTASRASIPLPAHSFCAWSFVERIAPRSGESHAHGPNLRMRLRM
jgi:hypothetical protein